MQKKFLQNLVLLMSANLIIKPFWIFGIDRFVQNAVQEEAYGLYFTVFNFSFIFQMLLDLGINNFNNREVSQSPTRLKKYFSSLFSFKLMLLILYFAITLAVALLSGADAEKFKLLLILCANMSLTSLILFFRSNIAALQLFKTDAFFSVFDRILAIGFCLIMMAGIFPWFQVDIYHFALAQTAALAISAVTAFCILVFNTSNIELKFDLSLIRELVVKALPFTLLGILMSIYNRSDTILIERLLSDGKEQAGIYGAAYRLYDAFMQFAFLFSVLLLPIFSRMLSKKQDISQLLASAGSLLMSGVVLISMCCLVFAEPLMHLLYQRADDYWIEVFRYVMISFIPAASVFVFGSVLTANGNLKQLNWLAFAGLLLNIGINIFIIPAWKAKGGAISSVLTQFLAGAGNMALAFYIFKMRFKWQVFFSWLLFIAYFLLAGWLYLTWGIEAYWGLFLAGLLLSGLLLAWLLGLIELRAMWQMLRARTE